MTLAFIPSPPANGLHLGPQFVHAYGLAYVDALLVAIAWIKRRWQAQGGEVALVEQVAVWACQRSSPAP